MVLKHSSYTGQTLINRYEVLELLGAGSMGQVFKVRDIKTDESKAVKLVNIHKNKVPYEALMRFKTEGDILKKLQHPSIIKYYDFFNEGDIHGLVMEYFPSPNLSQYLRKTGPFSLDKTLHLMRSLTEALVFIHDKKLMHLDLKPSNILLTTEEPDRIEIKILDFGFSQIIGMSENKSGGTLSYMAPEQTEILQKIIDHRADLYALGIVIYEVLVGHVPFREQDPSMLVYQHIAQIPEKPSTVRSEIPKVFENIILKLLNKDPDDRYRTTNGLLNDLKKYDRLCREQGTLDVSFTLGEEDHWDSFPQTNPFIGRSVEKKKIHDIIEKISPILKKDFCMRFHPHQSKSGTERYRHVEGNGSMFLLEGGKGIGKTELFRELFNELQKQIGVTWFHQAGKEGYEIPFKTIKTLLKNLEIYLDRLRESQQRRVKGFLKKRLKDDFGILKELIPKFSLFSEEQTPDSRYSVRNRTSNDYLDVVYDLFRRICRIEKRLIIFIDDFQHVEQSSVKLLFGLMERCRDLPILMVFSYTFEELSPEHRYHIDATINADYLEHLVLPPLNEAEVAGLTQWLFSNNLYEMPRLLEPLYYATQGNPSQLRTILQKLIDRGLIYFSDRSWHAKTEEVLKFIQDQRTITATLAPLMDWLPDEINVIKRSAVFLRCFTYGALNHLTAVKPAIEVSRNDLLRILDKAVQSNVLSVDKQKVYSYRDNNVRYALLSDLTTELRSDLHRAVARYLEKTELPDNPFSVRDIARHLDRSGDVKRAMEYYVKAAQLTDNGMFSDRQSEIYYNKALLCLKKLDENEVDVEVRFSVIYNAISHTFYYSREYDALWSEIQQLDSLIQGNKIRKMKSLSLRISLCHSMGHRKEMWQYGQELLDLGVDPEDEEYIVGSFFQLGSVVSDKSYTERIELIQRGIDIATRHKRYFLVIGSISVISILYSYLGRFREAEEITEKYLEVLKDSNLSDVRLMTVSWTRMLLELERGDFKKSLEYGKELESFQMIAGPSVVGLHQTCMATCYGMTGNFGESLRLFDQLLRQSAKTEHLSEILTVYQGRMMLALRMKEPETALTYFEKAKSQLLLRPDPYLDTMFHILAGSAYMDLSQLEEASAVIIKAGTIARKIESPLLQFHLRFPQIRLDWLKTLNKKCIAEANQLLEEMFEMGVSGYYEVYRDNLDTWLKHPGKSSTSMSHLKTGEASILKLFEISQKMSTTHNLDEIFEAALEGAMQISGANQGYLFTCCAKEHCVHEDISIPTLVRDAQGRTIDEADYLFSPAILDAVLRSKEIIVARDARNESRWKNCKSVQKFGLRSILAAPIMFDNKIRGFIYLDNHHAASVFSMRDKETVGVFATQVAIALNEAEAFTKQEEVSAENAKLYEEIREHNRNLEKQVNLRTRELNEKTEQLQELNKHLEEKVNEELGRRIEQEQLLIQQSKMAAMGEMIGMIAHQWRQPLSSISTVSGNLQIFLDLDMINKDEFSTMLTTINDQVQFLSNTINDFRNFFSPKKKAESVQLGSIIERTLSLIGKSLESKSIVIKENHSFLEPIVTYSNEIMQVFVNILKNAQDAIVEKKIVSPRIIITGKETESHQIVTISDNAGGISEDHLEKIFEPYFSTKDEKTGTGLGLYMSKIIVEKHCHGELNVWNTNDGACFEMKLPIKNPGLEAEVS